MYQDALSALGQSDLASWPAAVPDITLDAWKWVGLMGKWDKEMSIKG